MDISSRLKVISGDILGGLNAAVVTLPQALAFGVATGFGASAGIWGAIILSFIAGITGPKTPLISGATGPVAIVLASIMIAIGYDINTAITIILMAAILQLAASLTNLPDMVKYVPYPVISGFMNGVGFVIILMQLNPLIGYKAYSSSVLSINSFIANLHAIQPESFILGLMTLIIVFFTPKSINKVIPSQIIGLVVGTLISIKLNLPVDRICNVTFSFPTLMFKSVDISQMVKFLPMSLTIAIVLSSESMLTGLVSDALTKTRHNPKVLLASQGLGNLFCAITGSLPGTAATMRSVAAINAGATTKFAAIVTPAILLILLSKLSGFVGQIPFTVLAAILIKIGYDIIDTKLLKVIKFAPKDDLYVLFTVFFLTVFYNLIFAVGAGITLAALLYAKRVADKAKIIHKTVYDSDIANLEKEVERDFRHKIRIAHIDGQFFFGSATQLISKFDEMLGTKFLILNYDSEDLLDISAIFALEDIIFRLKSQHIKLLLVIKNNTIFIQLQKHNITSQIGEGKVFFSEIQAIDYAKNLLKKKFKNSGI